MEFIFIVEAKSPSFPVDRYKSISKFCRIFYYPLFDGEIFPGNISFLDESQSFLGSLRVASQL